MHSPVHGSHTACRKQCPPRMASIRKMDRLDCVSTDGTSPSVGSSEGGGVVALVVSVSGG